MFDIQGVISFENWAKETRGFKALKSYFPAYKLPERWHLSPRNLRGLFECKKFCFQQHQAERRTLPCWGRNTAGHCFLVLAFVFVHIERVNSSQLHYPRFLNVNPYRDIGDNESCIIGEERYTKIDCDYSENEYRQLYGII